jgi:hypothetical protein
MRNLSPQLYTSGKYTFLSNQPEQCQDTFNIKNSSSTQFRLSASELSCLTKHLQPEVLFRDRRCVQTTQNTIEFVQHEGTQKRIHFMTRGKSAEYIKVYVPWGNCF